MSKNNNIKGRKADELGIIETPGNNILVRHGCRPALFSRAQMSAVTVEVTIGTPVPTPMPTANSASRSG